jgi:hypothetical protein
MPSVGFSVAISSSRPQNSLSPAEPGMRFQDGFQFDRRTPDNERTVC